MKFGRAPTTARIMRRPGMTGAMIASRALASVDHKRAAIEQWTADPCGANLADGEPGSRAYFERLGAARLEYAPWMPDALGYDGAAGLRVLDIGCGQGIDVAAYARAGAEVVGVDLTPRHVELARAHLAALGLEAEILQADAERLPFPDAGFDRASSNGVLHHTPNIEAALREIRRVLRPGGEARIVVYNRDSLHYWLNQVVLDGVIGRKLLRERSMERVLSSGVEHSGIGARPLVRVYSARQLRRLMTRAGLASVTTSVRHFHAADAFVTEWLEGRVGSLRDPRVLDRIGRVAGWYVVGTGRRPRG